MNDFFEKKYILYELLKRDMKRQYANSYLGVIWALLVPMIYILSLFFVFKFGLKVKVATDDSYATYLTVGMVVWLFFVYTINGMVNSFYEYSFLIKKVSIPTLYIPLVKIVNTLKIHLILLLISMVLSGYNGYFPILASFQILYYLLALLFFTFSIGLFLAITNIFIPDVKKILSIMTTFLFWITPIFWNAEQLPVNYKWVVDFNPIYYLVAGYRESLIYGKWFWDKPLETIIFWLLTSIILFIAIKMYKKWHTEFVEVL